MLSTRCTFCTVMRRSWIFELIGPSLYAPCMSHYTAFFARLLLVLFRHTGYTHTHTPTHKHTLLCRLCSTARCLVWTDAAVQPVPQSEDENKRTFRGYSEIGNRMHREPAKITQCWCFTASPGAEWWGCVRVWDVPLFMCRDDVFYVLFVLYLCFCSDSLSC